MSCWVNAVKAKSEGVWPPKPGGSACAANRFNTENHAWASSSTSDSDHKRVAQDQVTCNCGPAGPSEVTAFVGKRHRRIRATAQHPGLGGRGPLRPPRGVRGGRGGGTAQGVEPDLRLSHAGEERSGSLVQVAQRPIAHTVARHAP
jgi:hypothetical protein